MCSWGVVGRWGSVGGAGRCVMVALRRCDRRLRPTVRRTAPRGHGAAGAPTSISRINFPHQLPTHIHSFPVGPSSAPVSGLVRRERGTTGAAYSTCSTSSSVFLAKGLAQRDTDKRPDRPNRTKQYYM